MNTTFSWGQITRPPLVSVIIANFNYEKYVTCAIHSVAEQTYPNIECFIVDDCSTDNSCEVIEECLRSLGRKRFCLIKSNENIGEIGASKLALDVAKGLFVTLLDADDFLFPDFVRLHVAAHLNNAQSAAISSSNAIVIDGEGVISSAAVNVFPRADDSSLKKTDLKNNIEISKIIPSNLQTKEIFSVQHIDRKNDIWPGVAKSFFMFRRNVLDHILPEPLQELRASPDGYLVSYAHALTGTLVIFDSLGAYRIHGKNKWASFGIWGGDLGMGNITPERINRKRALIALHIAKHFSFWRDFLPADTLGTLICRFLGNRSTIATMTRNEKETIKYWLRTNLDELIDRVGINYSVSTLYGLSDREAYEIGRHNPRFRAYFCWYQRYGMDFIYRCLPIFVAKTSH